MASTYTTALRLQIQASGENSGTWGDITSANLQSIEEAIAGYLSLSVAGSANVTLTATNSGIGTATDQSRNAILNLTGALTANVSVVIPNSSKQYWVNNATTGGFTLSMQTPAGGATALPGGFAFAFCDAANNVTVQAPITVNGVQTLTNKTLTSPVITTPTITGGSIAGPTINTPTITSGSATSLTLNQPQGVVTNVNFVAGSNISLTGNTSINSAGAVTIAASGGVGTVTSVGFSAGSGVTLTGNTSITGSGVVTIAATGGGSGTVTNVGLAAPTEFTVSGSPVNNSGTLTFSKKTQTANLVYAGPTSGGAAAPGFRALTISDFPGVSASGNTNILSLVVSNGIVTFISFA